MTYKLSAIIEREDKLFCALCPELDVASQGVSVEEAIANLKEAVQLYLETASASELSGLSSTAPLITTLEITT